MASSNSMHLLEDLLSVIHTSTIFVNFSAHTASHHQDKPPISISLTFPIQSFYYILVIP